MTTLYLTDTQAVGVVLALIGAVGLLLLGWSRWADEAER